MTCFIETAVEIEKIIEKKHNNEKIILRFLICSVNHHSLNCLKPYCRLNEYPDLVNKILLSSESTEQKIEKLQHQSRIYHQEFLHLYSWLKYFAGQARKEAEKKVETKDMTKENFMKEIDTFEKVEDLHFFY